MWRFIYSFAPQFSSRPSPLKSPFIKSLSYLIMIGDLSGDLEKKFIFICLLHRHLTAVTLRDIAIGNLLYRPLVATLISPLSRP